MIIDYTNRLETSDVKLSQEFVEALEKIAKESNVTVSVLRPVGEAIRGAKTNTIQTMKALAKIADQVKSGGVRRV